MRNIASNPFLARLYTDEMRFKIVREFMGHILHWYSIHLYGIFIFKFVNFLFLCIRITHLFQCRIYEYHEYSVISSKWIVIHLPILQPNRIYCMFTPHQVHANRATNRLSNFEWGISLLLIKWYIWSEMPETKCSYHDLPLGRNPFNDGILVKWRCDPQHSHDGLYTSTSRYVLIYFGIQLARDWQHPFL